MNRLSFPSWGRLVRQLLMQSRYHGFVAGIIRTQNGMPTQLRGQAAMRFDGTITGCCKRSNRDASLINATKRDKISPLLA